MQLSRSVENLHCSTQYGEFLQELFGEDTKIQSVLREVLWQHRHCIPDSKLDQTYTLFGKSPSTLIHGSNRWQDLCEDVFVEITDFLNGYDRISLMKISRFFFIKMNKISKIWTDLNELVLNPANIESIMNNHSSLERFVGHVTRITFDTKEIIDDYDGIIQNCCQLKELNQKLNEENDYNIAIFGKILGQCCEVCV